MKLEALHLGRTLLQERKNLFFKMKLQRKGKTYFQIQHVNVQHVKYNRRKYLRCGKKMNIETFLDLNTSNASHLSIYLLKCKLDHFVLEGT